MRLNTVAPRLLRLSAARHGRTAAPEVRGPLQGRRLPLPQERGVARASLCGLQHAQGDGGRHAGAG